MSASSDRNAAWPELDYAGLRDTLATLQLWTQIVGKVRLAECAIGVPGRPRALPADRTARQPPHGTS